MKIIYLLCAGNKVCVKYQAQGEELTPIPLAYATGEESVELTDSSHRSHLYWSGHEVKLGMKHLCQNHSPLGLGGKSDRESLALVVPT